MLFNKTLFCFSLNCLFHMFIFIIPLACFSCAGLKFEGDIYQHDQLPDGLCVSSAVREYGIYRVVGDHEEFISYCEPSIKKYLGVHEDELIPFLKEATRPTQ